MLAVESVRERHAAAVDEKYVAAFLVLSRQLAHDFNNIWARIFGLVQKAKEMPGFQERDEVLGRIDVVASSGLLYSRSIMDILMGFGSRSEVFDVCQVVREWAYRSSEVLRESIDISCLVPPHPLHVHFDQHTLRLILLSLIGYALRSTDSKRWAMLGVRRIGDADQSESVSENSMDIMFLCRMADYHGPAPNHFVKRVNAIKDLVAPHGGLMETWVVPNVGVNLRIRLPLAIPPTAPTALGIA